MHLFQVSRYILRVGFFQRLLLNKQLWECSQSCRHCRVCVVLPIPTTTSKHLWVLKNIYEYTNNKLSITACVTYEFFTRIAYWLKMHNQYENNIFNLLNWHFYGEIHPSVLHNESIVSFECPILCSSSEVVSFWYKREQLLSLSLIFRFITNAVLRWLDTSEGLIYS